MPYQIRQLLEGQGPLVSVQKEDMVTHALSLMIEHDFSQLPVISKDGDFENAEGMVTYEGIIRGVRNFKLSIEDLRVRDVMDTITVFSGDDDLFDILNRLKDTNAVLIRHDEFPFIEGIITTFDTTEYFRSRTEDLMRVEDIEVMIKDFIKEAYVFLNKDFEYEIDEEKLSKAVKVISNRGQNSKPKTFHELTMAEYINLLTATDTWGFFQKIFNLPIDSVKGLLHSVRETRNLLAHFRGDLSPEQRDRLRFTVDWLSRCQDEYQEKKERERTNAIIAFSRALDESSRGQELEEQIATPLPIDVKDNIGTTEFAVTEASKSGGRYAALADALQSQPGRVNQVPFTFNEIEEIIGSELPASARNHRAWWANDSVGHTQSQLWIDAGWRTTYVNLTEGKVTFSRIREREKAYIEFFSKLMDELRQKANFYVREVSPDGASWIVLQPIPRSGPAFGSFSFSFSRDKRLRVELYLDLLDKDKTKFVFDELYMRKAEFESQVGEIEWERLDNRRASRLALYRDGHITDVQKHDELRHWATDNMIKFYNTLIEPTEKAIRAALGKE